MGVSAATAEFVGLGQSPLPGRGSLVEQLRPTPRAVEVEVVLDEPAGPWCGCLNTQLVITVEKARQTRPSRPAQLGAVLEGLDDWQVMVCRPARMGR